MPNTDFKFQDGDQVVVNLGIKSPGGNARDLQVMANHITDFQLKQFKGGATEAHIKLYDETADSLEDVIFNSGALDNNPTRTGSSTQPTFYTSFGWTNGTKSPTWELVAHNYRSNYALGKGTEIELNCTGGLSRGIFLRGNRYYRRNESVAKIVRDIARDNNLDVDVEDGTITVSTWQRGRNDLRWLQIMANSGVFVSGSGARNYSVWVDNTRERSTLVCRPGNAPSPQSIEWSYIYGRDQEGQVKDWEVSINSMMLFALGSGGFNTTIINRGDKRAENLITNERTLPGLAGEGLIVPEASNTPAPLRLAFNTKTQALAYAANKWNRLNSTNIGGRLTILGNPAIKPSDFVSVTVITGSSLSDIRDIHPTSGKYEIVSIEHTITLGDYTTTLELVRKGNLTKGSGGSVVTNGSPAARRAVGAEETPEQPVATKSQTNTEQGFGNSDDVVNNFATPIITRRILNAP